MVKVAAALLALAVLSLLAPVGVCNHGNCPAIGSGPMAGACDPAIVVCGTYKRPSTCATVELGGGKFSCRCGGNGGR